MSTGIPTIIIERTSPFEETLLLWQSKSANELVLFIAKFNFLKYFKVCNFVSSEIGETYKLEEKHISTQ